MKRTIFCLFAFFLIVQNQLKGQLIEDTKTIIGGPVMNQPLQPKSRSASKPTACTGDTSYFPNTTTSGYRIVTVRKGNSLGQYFGANQSITVSGFRFFGYALTTTPPRNYSIRLICNIYKAGVDSLPTGAPLASDTVTVDTVVGSTVYLPQIVTEAIFKNPVTLNSDYIITVESDSSNVSAGIITNSWLATTPDGRKKNLGCGSVSGKWYRCLQLNIGGVTFDADMQMYPFVKYKLGADFLVKNPCYNFGDTVKFTNQLKNNVSGIPYYNYYLNYNLSYYCQRWSYDNNLAQYYIVDGFYKPTTKKNFDVQLISVVYSYTSGQCYDTVVKTVYFKPSRPTLKSSAFGCLGDTTTLSVSADAGVTVNWYKSTSDKTPFFTGTGYTIQNIQNSDTFYVQAVNGDCKSTFLQVNFTVSEHPKDPIIRNDSICQGAVANLLATSNKGNIEWYSSLTKGAPIYVGEEFQTDKLFADTMFYVLVNNQGCYNPSGKLAAKAFVNNSFAPGKPIVISDTSMCLRPLSTLELSASQSGNDTLRWFDVSTGGKPLKIGTNYTYSPKGRDNDMVYVETWNGVCGSGRSPITVHVYDYPTIFGLTGDTICNGDTAAPFLTVPWGEAHWFMSKKDVTPVFEGKQPKIGGIAQSQMLYIETSENGCISPNRDSVFVLVNSAPIPTSITAPSVCSKALGSMEVKVPFGLVNWYYDPSDQTPFSKSTAVNTGILLSNVTYYYETEFKGCKTAKTPLTVVVKPRPTAGFTWSLLWQNRLICTPITVAGLSLAWEWGDGSKTTGSPYSHQYATKGNYTVRMIATSNSNQCRDTAEIPVIIDHTGVKNVQKEAVVLYPVPVLAGGLLTLSNGLNSKAVDVCGLDGKVLETVNIANGSFVVPSHLTAGIYFVIVRTNEGTQSHKFVVAD